MPGFNLMLVFLNWNQIENRDSSPIKGLDLFKNQVDSYTSKNKCMCKLFKNFVGIDISKSSFDATLVRSSSPDLSVHSSFSQNPPGFSKMHQWLQDNGVSFSDETLFCMEDTGIYNYGLVTYLTARNARVWVEMALRIKRADGFERGSDDRSAALKIALYAYRYQDRAELWRPFDSKLLKIKVLIAQRDRIVKTINQLQVPLNELAECGCINEARELRRLQQPVIEAAKRSKEAIEMEIKALVQQEKELSIKVNQVKSITGIGQITAIALFVYTRGFTSFENAKQLACYCGVVPFKKESGTSVRSRPRVSQYANKKLKWLLHMCAMSAIRFDQELKAYYIRKKEEGKNKMSVLNAVRNKLVHRVFAVTRDNRVFEKDYIRKCA